MLLGLAQAESQGQTARLHARRIAVFGSSVANGIGDEYNREGYTGLLRALLAPRGWEVLNQSRGGDTPPRLARRWAPEGTADPAVRYLLPVRPSYVVIGLSYGNEGLYEAESKTEKDAVYQQYLDGIRGLVDRARRDGIVPVVSLAYPRSVYTPTDYEYVRRANLVQHQWDVPSVNTLGPLDDGSGRWAQGFFYDDKHPNSAGHKEVFYAYVPTLFDALEANKPTPVRPAEGSGFARVSGGVSPLTFSPRETMHAFALSVAVRTQGDGTVAAVHGSKLEAASERKSVQNGASTLQVESTTLTQGVAVTATVGVTGGKWAYTGSTGATISSAVAADAQWHRIALSHYTARGETLFFVDGRLAGTVIERLEPTRVVVGGAGAADLPGAPPQADYRDVFVFRAALNADEVGALHRGKVLQGSLEIYAPLADATLTAGATVENRAQSMSAFEVGAASIVHVEKKEGNTE
jgi:hypothetical protein